MGSKYSEIIHALGAKGITLDRKVLAEMAVRDLDGFRAVIEAARA